jgi:hypothetical protein
VLAMGQRDAGVGGAAGGGGDSRNDLEGNSRVDQGFDLFATAPEDEGVAALEANDLPARARKTSRAVG